MIYSHVFINFQFRLKLIKSSNLKLIRGEENVTFSVLVSEFYAKMAEVNPFVNINLDFVLGISENIDKIKVNFGVFNRFMSQERRNEIMEKVPSSLVINGKLARDLLQNNINFVDFGHMLDTMELNFDIYSEISYNLANKNDKMNKCFNKSYKIWKHNPVDQKHMQQVAIDFESMELEYIRLRAVFEMKMNAKDEIKRNIETMIAAVDGMFDELLNVSKSKELDPNSTIQQMVMAIVRDLTEIHKRRVEYMANLRNLRNILKDYNKSRVIWAEFLIGMRESLKSDSKPVQPEIANFLKKVLQNFSENIRGKIGNMCG